MPWQGCLVPERHRACIPFSFLKHRPCLWRLISPIQMGCICLCSVLAALSGSPGDAVVCSFLGSGAMCGVFCADVGLCMYCTVCPWQLPLLLLLFAAHPHSQLLY
jgi:hypothetical protein